MKTNKKLIAGIILIVLALLVSACAFADERLYTSEPFKIPASRVQGAGDTAHPTSEEGEEPEASEEEELPEGEQPEEGEEPAEGEEADEGEEPAEGTEVPEEEIPAEGEEPAESEELPEGETPEPAEAEQPEEEAGEEFQEAGGTDEVLPTEKRQVFVTVANEGVITEGDTIYLESRLEGFGDLPVTYRWQVDKNDGEGWQDIPGADRDRHMFIATVETVQYNWRLIVDVVGE